MSMEDLKSRQVIQERATRLQSWVNMGNHNPQTSAILHGKYEGIATFENRNFNSSLGCLNESTTSEGTLMPNVKKSSWSGNPQGVAKSSTQTKEQQR